MATMSPTMLIASMWMEAPSRTDRVTGMLTGEMTVETRIEARHRGPSPS